MKKILQLLFISSLLLFNCLSCVNEPQISRNSPIENENIVGKRDVDVLVVCYMDGDNNLYPLIKGDLREAVQGYNYLDDTDNVEVVVLFDYVNFGDSALYRIGKNNKLYDVSSNIDWLKTKNEKDEICNEVSMCDYNTLLNFLTWVNDHYNYNSVILQLSDHGAGPGDINLRAMCQDYNNREGFSARDLLSTEMVPRAIKESGIKKVDLVIQDVCLGSTIEEIYEYKDCADYMYLSPNAMPGEGLNYTYLIATLKNNRTIFNGKLDVEKYINDNVANFIESYSIPQEKWDELKIELKNINITDLELSLAPLKMFDLSDKYGNPKYWNYTRVSTITGIKVNEVISLNNSFNDMILLMMNNENKQVASSFLSVPINISYKNYLKNKFDTMDFYKATVGNIYDIGFICNELITVASNNSFPELVAAAKNVKEHLDKIVVASWRDGVGGALYNKSSKTELKGIYSGENETYGIAIAGFDYIDKVKEGYSDKLLFAKDSCWDNFGAK